MSILFHLIDDKGLIIYAEIVSATNLNWTSKVVLSLIIQFGHIATNKDIAEYLKISEGYLSQIKRRLAKAGYLEKEILPDKQVRYIPVEGKVNLNGPDLLREIKKLDNEKTA